MWSVDFVKPKRVSKDEPSCCNHKEASTQTLFENDCMDLIVAYLNKNLKSFQMFVKFNSPEAEDQRPRVVRKPDSEPKRTEMTERGDTVGKKEAAWKSTDLRPRARSQPPVNPKYMDELKNVLRLRPVAQPIEVKIGRI